MLWRLHSNSGENATENLVFILNLSASVGRAGTILNNKTNIMQTGQVPSHGIRGFPFLLQQPDEAADQEREQGGPREVHLQG